jgi:hypothetical protein
VNLWSETNFIVHTLNEKKWASQRAAPKKQARHCVADCARMQRFRERASYKDHLRPIRQA